VVSGAALVRRDGIAHCARQEGRRYRLRRRVVDSAPFSKPLIFIYLLPTLVIAMHYGSTLAVLTSFASGLIAAYFFIIITKLEYLILNHLFRVRSNSRMPRHVRRWFDAIYR
jgi:hypothetical protein